MVCLLGCTRQFAAGQFTIRQLTTTTHYRPRWPPLGDGYWHFFDGGLFAIISKQYLKKNKKNGYLENEWHYPFSDFAKVLNDLFLS